MTQGILAHSRTLALPRLGRRTIAYAAAVLFALAVRLPLLAFESGDYRRFLGPWYDEITRLGFADAMAVRIGDYSPPYFYLLGALTALDAPKLEGIKLLSVGFDFALAAAVFLAVRAIRPGGAAAPLAAAAVLFAPTVVMNSALWAQCDAIYTACLVASVALLLRRRPWWAMALFGVAFAFKVQAVFLAPALLAFTFRGRLHLAAWLLVPAVYLLAITPAWLLGRPFWDLVMLYRDQAEQYPDLTLNAPNIYQWLPDWPPLRTIGMWATAVASLAFAAACAWPGRPLDGRRMLAVTLASALLVPFLLPHMHERYWYPADVLAIAYASVVPRRWYVPLLVVAASALSYWPFLFQAEPVPLDLLAAALAAALAITTRDAVLGPPLPRRAKVQVPAAVPEGAG